MIESVKSTSTNKPVTIILLYSLLLIPTLLLGSCRQNRSVMNTDEGMMNQSAPVWADGREKEMNLTLGFRGGFHCRE